jgi:hypothetical protein
MNPVSAILRIICGLVLIILAYSTYNSNSQHFAAGEPLRVFGFTTSASPGQLTFAFGAIGLIGLLLIGLGVVTLLKSRR